MYEETHLKQKGQKQFPKLSFILEQGRKIYSADCQLSADIDERHLIEDAHNC